MSNQDNAAVSSDTPTPTNALTPAQAKEYDHIIVIDQSGSMSTPSTKMQSRSRWQEAQEFTENYARFVEKLDDDGLTVVLFNSKAKVYDGVKADKVTEIFTTNQPGGSTNLAEALQKAIDKKFSNSKKAIVLVLTDGIPDSEDAVKKAIIDASNKLEKDEDLGFMIVQIGDDAGAAKFLTTLDDHLQSAGAKYDIVDCKTREEAEQYSVEQLLWLALND